MSGVPSTEVMVPQLMPSAEDVTSSCELGIIEIELSIHSSEIYSRALLDKYVRQDREREAGNEKHSHAEHRVWIFDRDTCSIGCFVLRCETKRFLTLQLLDFRSSLARIVHLPVPSESFSRRGKKICRRLRVTYVSRVLEQRSSRRWFAGEASAITKGNEGTKVVPQSDQIGIYIELPKVN